MSPRYAVYFAPGGTSPWWTFGAHWLGRNACDDTPLPQPRIDEIAPKAMFDLTAEPRRYGFHATLKAPFRLVAGHDEASLMLRLQSLAQQLSPVALGPLTAVSLGSFVALVPATGNPQLQAFAASCVTELDDMRAALLPAELARRQPATLDFRGTELLAIYGYPHVLERFRFHLTLTGPTHAEMAAKVIRAATPDVDRLNGEAPLQLDRLCVFREASPGLAFQRIGDVPLPRAPIDGKNPIKTYQSHSGHLS